MSRDCAAVVTRHKSFALALAAPLTLAAAIFVAPVAGATVEFYLEEVRAKVRTPLTDQEALQLGNVACEAMRAGIANGLTFGKARHEADQAVGYASQGLGISLTLADGMFLVEAAEDQLC